MDCPADTYTEKFTVYNGADDTRSCGVCWCGTGTATCEGTLDVSGGAGGEGLFLVLLDRWPGSGGGPSEARHRERQVVTPANWMQRAAVTVLAAPIHLQPNKKTRQRWNNT